MPDRLAILAGGGALPVELATRYPDALRVGVRGVANEFGASVPEFAIEEITKLWTFLKSRGVTGIVFAGAMTRPRVEPATHDSEVGVLLPGLRTAMRGGDDGLLRQVIAAFEEQGFTVFGAHELLPELVAEDTLAIGTPPSDAELADAARACDILSALSPLDVGQGCVVADGQCLGIETMQGTDALLRFAADTPAALRRPSTGVFVKTAKRGQDLRADMPVIGPDTIKAVAAAGLAGIVIEAGRVMILHREETRKAVLDNGLFLTAGVF